MGIINILPTEISNKIAAGEVVEKPASVVKELVENSIDAGSSVISVEIKKGGISYIRVSDNGKGMSCDDAQVAFLRHATSKIKTENDLDAIYTLGFRGEALSSIGAVAQVDLYTKRAEDTEGTHITCTGGEVESAVAEGTPNGTTFVVHNLFYNTPARMNFLKRDASEAAYVTDIMERFILSHPEISFRYILDGKDKYFTAGDGNLTGCIYAIYGKSYVNSIIPVDYEDELLKIKGIIGKGDAARPNRNFQSYFINKRYIKSIRISNIVESAYKNQIMIGKHPMAILNIEINPKFVDINVHPTKLEVKFSREEEVMRAIYHAVQNALYALPNVPKIEREQEVKTEFTRDNVTIAEQIKIEPTPPAVEEVKPQTTVKWEKRQIKEEQIPTKSEYALKADNEYFMKKKDDIVKAFEGIAQIKEENVAEKTGDSVKIDVLTKLEETVSTGGILEEKEELPWGFDAENVKIVGQIFDTYIIAQSGDKMIVIDQHAAHERLKYEELKRELEAKQVVSQMLLVPVTVNVTAREIAVFSENAEKFFEMGFEIEEFGDNILLVRATPEALPEGELASLVVELLDELSENRQEIISEKMQRALYTIACKAAVKANHKFDQKQLEVLTKEILALKNINTCPHGRPIIITMSQKELEKEFKRIV